MDASLEMEDHRPNYDGSNADHQMNEVSFDDHDNKADVDTNEIQLQGEQENPMEVKLRTEREQMSKDIAAKFQSALNDIKITTKRLMAEMDHMMMINEGVTIDYTKVLDSQQTESRRLEEAEPDVMNLTTKMQQAIQTGNLSHFMGN